jgi:hypothetical protein
LNKEKKGKRFYQTFGQERINPDPKVVALRCQALLLKQYRTNKKKEGN